MSFFHVRSFITHMRSSKDANNVKNDRKIMILEQKSFQRLFLKNRLPHREKKSVCNISTSLLCNTYRIVNFLVKAHFDGSWL